MPPEPATAAPMAFAPTPRVPSPALVLMVTMEMDTLALPATAALEVPDPAAITGLARAGRVSKATNATNVPLGGMGAPAPNARTAKMGTVRRGLPIMAAVSVTRALLLALA